MTHSVNGNIIVPGRFSEYDRRLTNGIVEDFTRKSGRYAARYDPDHGITTYSRDGEVQPFISVFDKPAELSEWKPHLEPSFRRALYLFVCVESGSHVGVQDAEYAKEIYDTTLKLRRLLRRVCESKIEILFDDEKKLYLPSDFRDLIKQAA
ncbi:MAG: hypothetical protein HYW25_05180 [Candidatus Aenigmarchaeota archaeon]|nr:hypothetical protein [Candidatus Aenigmarchaeota archaeon]